MTSESPIELKWRVAGQRIAEFVNAQVLKVGLAESAWVEGDLDDHDNYDPIAVMGASDTRSDWVGAVTQSGKRSIKMRERPDLARRYFISRAQSPVGNFFEKKKDWTRQAQIDAFRNYVWNEWIQKGNIRTNADKWLRARAAEVNAGKLIDLVSGSRQFSRKRRGVFSKSAPYDCHGHVIRALILIYAGKIDKENFFDVQADYLLKMEGDPEGNVFQKAAQELVWKRDAADLDLVVPDPPSEDSFSL